MGQVTSKLLAKPTGPTEPFPLESVPVDVLFMIADHLDPVAYMSLAMTCKPFYYLLHNRGRLDGEDREAFVQQLERDVGDEKWYCHFATGSIRSSRPGPQRAGKCGRTLRGRWMAESPTGRHAGTSVSGTWV